MSELTIKDLKQDKRNYRKHNKSNLDLIKKSIAKVGFGRSVVIDNNNEIIAGNGLVSQVDKNTKIKVIETDGSELVVVKRTDLSTEDEKRKEMAVFDNSTSDTSESYLDKLQNDFSLEKLRELGIDIKKAMQKEKQEQGEVPFSEELLEEHNYIVLYFDNSVDWLQAESLFGLKKVKDLDSKSGYKKEGIGRVIKGSQAIEQLRKEFEK